jgi:aspartate racemase
MTSIVEKESGPVLGIIGGVGPLASSEFLKTIYEHTLSQPEQGAPFVMMYSDPRFPDRTEALLSGNTELLFRELLRALERLDGMGVSKIVICCVTMHYLLPRLPARLRARLLSLLDIIFAEVLREGKKHLLLCSSGTRQLRVFESHEQWKEAGELFVLPAEQDQKTIHEVIYQIKRNSEISLLAPTIEALLAKYRVNRFISGCTEFHLLAKHFARACGSRKCYGSVDPLMIIAKKLAEDK